MKKKIFISFSVMDKKGWSSPLNLEKDFKGEILLPIGTPYQLTFKADAVLHKGKVVDYCYDDNSETIFILIQMNFVIGVVGDRDLLKAKFIELSKNSGFCVSFLDFEFKKEEK